MVTIEAPTHSALHGSIFQPVVCEHGTDVGFPQVYLQSVQVMPHLLDLVVSVCQLFPQRICLLSTFLK